MTKKVPLKEANRKSVVKYFPFFFAICFLITLGTLIVLDTSLNLTKNPLSKLIVVQTGLFIAFTAMYFLINPLQKIMKTELGFSFFTVSIAQFMFAILWLLLLSKTEYITLYKGTKLIFAGSFLSYLMIEAGLMLIRLKMENPIEEVIVEESQSQESNEELI